MLCSFYPVLLIIFLQNGYITGLTDWPDGKYGLLKPVTGCPDEWSDKNWNFTKVKNSRWNFWEYNGWTDRGFVFQVTEETDLNDKSSETLHFDGDIASSFVMRYFCVKRTDVTRSSKKWPPGQYCTYDKSRDGSKKQLGWIRMYDRDYRYEHAMKYVYDFVRDSYIGMTLYFACHMQTKGGNKKIPISLPIAKPFYLLPYGSRECQQVKWMVATSEWIKYHTDNYIKRRRQKSGEVPYHKLGDFKNRGITLYYCYYESCKYTLTDKKGVFQSPGFPGKYPDGQLCSWRIMVPDNYTLHVHFTHFSLIRNDKLQVYEIFDGLFTLKYTFYGNMLPNLTATNDVEFVFTTDTLGSSTGFQAKYRASKNKTTPLTTTKKLQTSTTNPTTTTKPPTTKAPTTKPLQANKPPKPKPQQGTTKTNTPTRKITNTTQRSKSNNGASKAFKGSRLFSCDMTLNIVVMVIPLVCSLLIIVFVVDIVYRCRHRKIKLAKSKSNNSRNVGCLAVNMTYERGDIILDQTPDTTTDVSTVDTVDDPPESRDEPPDYEDLDYTQVNDIPPPRRSLKRQERHALEPIRTDTSSHSAEPVGNGAPEVFYHTLETPTDWTRSYYQNLFEVNHDALSPVCESAEYSAC